MKHVNSFYFDDAPHALVFAFQREREGYVTDVFLHADGLEWVVGVFLARGEAE